MKLNKNIEQYLKNEAPMMAGRKTLRFIEGNFAAKGYQGASFSSWKPSKKKRGSTLIDSGRLRRSFEMSLSPHQARILSNVPYAKAHNEGFKGTVSVRPFDRKRYAKASLITPRINKNGVKKARTIHVVSSVSIVKAHTKKMNIPKRQFAPIHPSNFLHI